MARWWLSLLLLSTSFGGAVAQSANNAVAICNPANNKNCIVPNADGSINAGVGTAAAATIPAPNAVAICSPSDHSVCLLPNSDGSINIVGGGGGGSITANSTPTSGFSVGQPLISDGSKVQALVGTNGSTSNAGMKLANNVWMWAGDNTGVSWGLNSNTGTYYPAAGINIPGGGGTGGSIVVGLGGFFGFTANGILNSTNVGIFGGVPATPQMVEVRNPNGAAPTALRVNNTWTDANNGEWGALDWVTTPNVLTIGTQANGTGQARPVQFVVNSSSYMDLGMTHFGYTYFSTPIWLSNNTFGNTTVNAGGYMSNQFVNPGRPTITGSGGTCATSTKLGGATVGTVVLSGVCATGNTIVFTGMPTSDAGWACDAEDRTTRTALFVESASTTTGFTLTTGAVSSVANDVLQWKCMGY